MTRPPELRSEAFTRWAKAAWPNLVGLFGLGLIFFDCILNPPPDATSGIGLVCIGATGFVNLNRLDKKAGDE